MFVGNLLLVIIVLRLVSYRLFPLRIIVHTCAVGQFGSLVHVILSRARLLVHQRMTAEVDSVGGGFDLG